MRVLQIVEAGEGVGVEKTVKKTPPPPSVFLSRTSIWTASGPPRGHTRGNHGLAMWEPECPLEWPRLFPDLCPREDQWGGPRIPGEED